MIGKKINEVTNVMRGFIVTSLTSSVVVIVAIYVKAYFDSFKTEKKNGTVVEKKSSIKGLIITFLATFVAYMLGYTLSYYAFGFSQ